MPYKTEKIALNDAFLKRSTKLLPCQKEMILYWGNKGLSQRKIAKMFNVSRRLIIFILFPDKLKANKEARKDRGGSMIYYKKDKHKEAINSLRKHKENLFKYQNFSTP